MSAEQNNQYEINHRDQTKNIKGEVKSLLNQFSWLNFVKDTFMYLLQMISNVYCY